MQTVGACVCKFQFDSKSKVIASENNFFASFSIREKKWKRKKNVLKTFKTDQNCHQMESCQRRNGLKMQSPCANSNLAQILRSELLKKYLPSSTAPVIEYSQTKFSSLVKVSCCTLFNCPKMDPSLNLRLNTVAILK